MAVLKPNIKKFTFTTNPSNFEADFGREYHLFEFSSFVYSVQLETLNTRNSTEGSFLLNKQRNTLLGSGSRNLTIISFLKLFGMVLNRQNIKI